MSCIPCKAAAARTVQVVPQDKAVAWEGWGTSLAWFGHALGHNPSTRETVCQLLFSKHHGLGLNIVRCADNTSALQKVHLSERQHVDLSARCFHGNCSHLPVLVCLQVQHRGCQPRLLPRIQGRGSCALPSAARWDIRLVGGQQCLGHWDCRPTSQKAARDMLMHVSTVHVILYP
jgi:hypothetical protein